VEVEHFQERVRAIAFGIVDAVIRQELQRRLERLTLDAPTKPRKRAIRVRHAPPREVQVADPPGQPKIALDGRKPTWTRDAIVNELASWLVSGTTIDAAFVTRYGPPGLVAATRKIFGRFDAALNVAGLQVAAQYPDGPPTRRTT
jgi:hypothetical protein